MRKHQRGFGGVTMYMGIVLVVVIAGSAAYFKYSQDKLAEANQKVAVQTARAESAEANYDALKEDVAEQTAALNRLTQEMAENRKAAQTLEDTFAEHDLNDLVNRKPDLVQKLVNKGTAEVFERVENITDPRTYNTKPNQEFLAPEEADQE